MKAAYTNNVIPENPRNKSDKNMASNGKIKVYFLFPKYTPEKRAIAVIGVTFGKCGNKRNNAATIIKDKRINCFLLNKEVMIAYLMMLQK